MTPHGTPTPSREAARATRRSIAIARPDAPTLARLAVGTSLLVAMSILAAPALARDTTAVGGAVEGTWMLDRAFEWGTRNTDFPPAFDGQFRAPIQPSGITIETEVIADGLTHPCGIAALPDGRFLVTEQEGRLRRIASDSTLSEPIGGIPAVYYEAQGGLLDVALDPNFQNNRMVHITYAKPLGSDGAGGRMSATAAARGTLSDDYLEIVGIEDIFVQQPASPTPKHYGSRILFDSEGHAFITTGEHFSPKERDYAQDFDKTYGKVIRINPDGSIPDTNPFRDAPDAEGSIWSLGHRNIQGAAIDADGTLYTIEHGPKGGDELNRPKPGKNYGWSIVSYGRQYDGPLIGIGEASREGFEQPLYFWDPVIAPGGMAFYSGDMFPEWNGDLLIGSYVAKGVVRLDMEDGRVVGEERFLNDLGRIRDVIVLDDGSLVLLTDKQDGEVVRATRVEG